METDVRRNPALLKLDLYCRGMRLDDSCFLEADGGRQILRTRAGLGSGIELILPGGLWTNVPVTETFAASSPYVLHRDNGQEILAGRRVLRTTRPAGGQARTLRAVGCERRDHRRARTLLLLRLRAMARAFRFRFERDVSRRMKASR